MAIVITILLLILATLILGPDFMLVLFASLLQLAFWAALIGGTALLLVVAT